MQPLRIAVRLAAIAVLLLFCLSFHAAWRLARRPSPWPRRFLRAMARIAGARARVVGVPLDRDVVFLCNHLSWLDILLVADATGSAFVSKAEVARVPIVGRLAGMNDTIFVDRADRLGVTAQVARLRWAVASGRPIAVFPEGTTGDGSTLLPFKPALLAALDPPPAGVRVQPVVIDYGEATRELAWTGDEPGAGHARRVLGRAGTFTATLRFLAPFDPAIAGGRKAIAAEARARMEAAGGAC